MRSIRIDRIDFADSPTVFILRHNIYILVLKCSPFLIEPSLAGIVRFVSFPSFHVDSEICVFS